MIALETLDRVELVVPAGSGSSKILTPKALQFVSGLHRGFEAARRNLLIKREERQMQIDAGSLPDFLPDDGVRTAEWSVAEIPADLLDRKVEITGPAGDRKMVINALNSGASTYMADFEDSQSPTWSQTMEGQINLADVVDRTIRYVSAEGKVYALNEHPATLIVRPRGLHLLEKHVMIGGEPCSAALFDFGLYLYHNAEKLIKRGTGPYFYLPKLEGRLEARFWEQVLSASEDYLGLPRGTVKVTVLIETLPAAFEMDEILFELRAHIVGLNCGRWDYIFSYIKKLRNHPQFLLPNRSQLTMDKGFLAPYVDLLIKTCHRRGAYAIGGMSAYIPVKGDDASNQLAMAKVRADKKREFSLGHDGTWVAHPGLVPTAKQAFSGMDGFNQMRVLREDVVLRRDDLLRVPAGTVTMEGLDANVSVGLRYLEAWLGGRGCVPINNLMEDAATTEICRAQLWQWARHGARLNDGRTVTTDMILQHISGRVSELSKGAASPVDLVRVSLAGELFARMISADSFPDFITLAAYEELLAMEGKHQ